MNSSDNYYLKLNLTLLSLNIDEYNKDISSLGNKNNNEQKKIYDKIDSNEIMIDSNFMPEKLNLLIMKLNPASFGKSNSSLMCQIIYFLLMCYDANQYSSSLRLCYPVITLNDLKIFKEATYKIMESILPKSILCGKSILDEASGKKIEKFLREFSDFVVSSKISEKINKKNTFYEQLLSYKNNNFNNAKDNNKENNILINIRKNCLVTQISNLRETIIEKLKNINNIQNNWKKTAKNITFELEKETEKNNNLKNKYNTIINGNKTRFSEISSLDRAPKIENHAQFVKMVDSLHNKFIQDEDFKNNIDYINNKDVNDIIDSLNSKKIFSDSVENNISKNESYISNIEANNEKKELELLINEIKEKRDKNFNKNGDLFVLHEQINILDKRIKDDNTKFIERNANDKKEYKSNTEKLGMILDEQIDKLKNIENLINKLNNDLNHE